MPDLMWLAQDSMTINPVLIELEAPGKRWFTGTGQPRAELTQALNQIADWRTWFNDPANQSQFFDLYRIDSESRGRQTFAPTFCLVYGRRAEFAGKPRLNKKRAAVQPAPDTRLMTYDRLQPHSGARSAYTVKKRKRAFDAIAVGPAYQIGPNNAHHLLSIQDTSKPILSNAMMTPERKEFLLTRLVYWEQWARAGAMGLRSSGDWE